MIQGAILHSVSYCGFWGQKNLPLAEFIDKAAALGYDGVMLAAKRPQLSVLDYDHATLAVLRSRIAERGLKHVVIAGYTNFTADMEHGDIPQLEFQIRHVVELAAMANALGGTLVRVFTGYENAAAAPGVQYKRVVDALGECARRAAEYGVVIGVQNHHDIACGYESLHDLIEEVNHPNCRAMFDAWAPALHGEDLPTAARKLAKYTVHTTIANYRMRPRYRYVPSLVNYEKLTPEVKAVPMDKGFIDYAPFLAELEAGGYSGTVAYEMCSPLEGGGSEENLDRCARGFLEWLARYRGGGATK
jgi:sugar phosphate isomerase/epimerase